MKRRSLTAVLLAACMAVGACGCSSADDEEVFTGDIPEVPEWQASLDAISPAVYAEVDDLDLEPGTYISVIGKTENTSYWKQAAAGVQQAADDITGFVGGNGACYAEDQGFYRHVTYGSPLGNPLSADFYPILPPPRTPAYGRLALPGCPAAAAHAWQRWSPAYTGNQPFLAVH